MSTMHYFLISTVNQIHYFLVCLTKLPITIVTFSKGEEKFWRIPKTEADIIQPWKEWSPQNEEFRALDIETTAYMLQGYNLNDDTKNGTRILRWFGRRRRSRGGFKSAQVN